MGRARREGPQRRIGDLLRLRRFAGRKDNGPPHGGPLTSPRRIGLFFKTGEPGQAKTRLVPPLSPEAAARLSDAFALDAVGLCRTIADTEIILFRTGPPARLPQALRDFSCREQRGRDLGERMGAALADLLSEGNGPVLLLGCDVPTLPPKRLEAAFDALEGADLVLGPSHDGGYWLIGMKTPLPAVFREIAWGSSSVLETTLDRAREVGARVHLLEGWYDVDTGRDLERLIDDLRHDTGPARRAPATRRVLEVLGLLPP